MGSKSSPFVRLIQYRTYFLMMLPALIWFVVYRYVPMYGVTIAFKDFRIMQGLVRSPWASPLFKHFERFFSSTYAPQIIGNTLIISTAKLVLGVTLPVVLALLLNEVRIGWFKRIVQTLTYMPHFLSWVIVYGVFLALFSQHGGLVNAVLREAGRSTVPFLSSPGWFRPVVVVADAWRDTGWSAIIYLAAISGIDQTLYDAAKIDGCGRLRSIVHVTLPGIRSVVILLLVLRTGKIMDADFEQLYVFLNVHVLSVGDIIDTWVFRAGLEELNFSLAGAVGFFKSFVGLFLIATTNRIARIWGENLW
jgi:putative aldouronate transport system permease protein